MSQLPGPHGCGRVGGWPRSAPLLERGCPGSRGVRDPGSTLAFRRGEM